jgi:hypothetical protein
MLWLRKTLQLEGDFIFAGKKCFIAHQEVA